MPKTHQTTLENKPLRNNSLRLMIQKLFDVNQSEFSNRLSHPEYFKFPSLNENWVLLSLFLFALVPRLIMLNFANGSSDDSYYYIHVARILGEGDYSYRGAFYYLGLNIYPAILLFLHRMGLDWLHAGMLWGVTISAFTVLPLYGWVKRLFDQRVAIVASFLFAIHPDFIEYSIDPIREPTYWFFVSLFLYFGWRSITESKIWLYSSLGLTFCLAIHTRSESWILLIPFSFWYLVQFFSNRVPKRIMIIGLLVMVSVTPLLLLILNITILKNEEKWQFGRLYYFKVVASYLMPAEDDKPDTILAKTNTFPIKKIVNAPSVPPLKKSESKKQVTVRKTVTPVPASKQNLKFSVKAGSNASKQVPTNSVSLQKQIPSVKKVKPEEKSIQKSMIYLYCKTLIRTHEPILSILHLIGILVFFRQLLFQIDKTSLLLFYIALLLAIWLRTDTSHNINGRYFFSLFFLTVPFQALGFMVVCKALGKISQAKLDINLNPVRLAPVLGLIFLLTSFYWADAFTSHHFKREEQIKLGKWLHKNMPEVKTILVDRNSTRIGYYAQGSSPQANYHHALFSDLIKKNPPDLVIFSKELVSDYFKKNTTKLVKPLGLEPIDTSLLHPLAKNYLILAKQPPRSVMNIASDSDSSSIH